MLNTFWIGVREGNLEPLLAHLGKNTLGKLRRGDVRMSMGEIGGGWKVLWSSDTVKELVDIDYLTKYVDEGDMLVVIASSVSELVYVQYLTEGECVWVLDARPGNKPEDLVLDLQEDDIEGNEKLFAECIGRFVEEGGAAGYEAALRFLKAFMERDGASIDGIPGNGWKAVDLGGTKKAEPTARKRTFKSLQKELEGMVKVYADQNELIIKDGVSSVYLVTGEEAYLRTYLGMRPFRHEARNFEFECGISNQMSGFKDGKSVNWKFWEIDRGKFRHLFSKWETLAEGVSRGESVKEKFSEFISDAISIRQQFPVWTSIEDVQRVVDQWSSVSIKEVIDRAIFNAANGASASVPDFPSLKFSASFGGWAVLYFSTIYSLLTQDRTKFHIDRLMELLSYEIPEIPSGSTIKRASSIFDLFGYYRIELAESLSRYVDLSGVSISYLSIPREKIYSPDSNIRLYSGEAERKVGPSFPKPTSRLTRIGHA